jgi:hypothetical protein
MIDRLDYATSLHPGKSLYFGLGAFAGGLLLALSVSGAASAQSASYFARDHNVGVNDRPRPDYAPSGLTLGQFVAYPTLSIQGEYDDNIYATPSNASSDFVTTVSPGLNVSTNWAQNSLGVHASSTSNVYAAHSTEDTTDYNLGGSGRLDVAEEASVSASVAFNHNTQSRTAENNISSALEPLQFGVASASISGIDTINRLQISGNVQFQNVNYSNDKFQSGQILDLSYLAQNSVIANSRLSYALNPEIALFGDVTYNDRVDTKPNPALGLNRSSHGYELDFGSSFDITRLIRGSVQVGYLEQDYSDQIFHAVGGPSVHANVEYFFSGLTTFQVGADRQVTDAVSPQAVSILQTDTHLEIDHELLRNVILTGRGAYESDKFTGIDRTDQRTNFSVGASYLMNRLVSLNATYSFLRENSSGISRINPYSVNVLSLGLQLHL